MANKKYKAEDLVTALRCRYEDHRRYALFEQVANATGYGARSWVDAVVMCLWPSDGLNRMAFEVKISRADFLNELANPTKNAWARHVCNEFWFVAPKDVIKEEELPEGDGWLRPHGKGLAIVRHAKRKQADDSVEFIAALARSMQKQKDWAKADLIKEALDTSQDYQKALAYERAVRRFAGECGGHLRLPHYHSGAGTQAGGRYEKEILETLKSLRMDDSMKLERRQVTRALEVFQGKLRGMLDMYLAVAFTGILETDEIGRYLVKLWGGEEDASTIGAKRALAKKKRGRYRDRGADEIVKSFDNMLALARERLAEIESED